MNDVASQITIMVMALKSAYGTTPDITSNPNIANLLATSSATAVTNLGIAIVNYQLGGKATT